MIQTGVTASELHGKASWIVQPKNARLITPVSTNERQRPDARPIDRREQSDHRRLPQKQFPDLHHAGADRAQQRQLARALGDQSRERETNSHDRHEDGNGAQHVGDRERLIENLEDARAQVAIRQDHELPGAAELGAKLRRQRLGRGAGLEIDGEAVDAIVFPMPDESSLGS